MVIGDLDNHTGDARYDDALEGALRVGMEQSRFVNVVSSARIRDALAMMQRDPATTAIDRQVGAELAQRVGARVLLLPSVRLHDGRVRVSIQAIDPASGLSLFSESAAGTPGGDWSRPSRTSAMRCGCGWAKRWRTSTRGPPRSSK